MEAQETKDEWLHLDEDGSSPDLSREHATFERHRAELVSTHRGKIACIHGDDIVGIYDNIDDAVIDSVTRLGWVRLIYCLIEEPQEPAWISNFDPTHPSFRPDKK